MANATIEADPGIRARQAAAFAEMIEQESDAIRASGDDEIGRTPGAKRILRLSELVEIYGRTIGSDPETLAAFLRKAGDLRAAWLDAYARRPAAKREHDAAARDAARVLSAWRPLP